MYMCSDFSLVITGAWIFHKIFVTMRDSNPFFVEFRTCCILLFLPLCYIFQNIDEEKVKILFQFFA